MRIAALIGWVVVWAASTASAQDWAVKMFTHTAHDFGTVARGAKVAHAFVLENIYEEDVHIASVTSSCGCTMPQVVKPWLKTWERTEIIASVDTRSFLGRKDATLTVTFDKPFRAEVQLQCHTFIRGDVVIQPGVVQFGNVDQGGMKQKVSVTYAGRPDWRIERVESANPNITAQAIEVGRSDNQVSYDLVVTLKNGTPVGYIQDHVVLVTNDYSVSATRVPVPVEGIVTPAISVSPALLMLGVTEPGQKVTRQLVLKGKTPFRVLNLSSDDPRFKLNVLSEAKTLHLVPVSFTADDSLGSVTTKIHVQTDQAGAVQIDVPVQVEVVARRGTSLADPKAANPEPEAGPRNLEGPSRKAAIPIVPADGLEAPGTLTPLGAGDASSDRTVKPLTGDANLRVEPKRGP